MVRKSEAQRKGKTRLSAAIEAVANNPEEMLREHQASEQMDMAAEDWIGQSKQKYQNETSLYDDFVFYFRDIYRSSRPDSVVEGEDDPLQKIELSTDGVEELLCRFKGFLLFRLRRTPGHHGRDQITASTFKSWAVRLIDVSLRKLEMIDKGRGHLFSGWTKLGKEGLYSEIQGWVQSTVLEHNLSQVPPQRRFYGKTEAALCFKAIMDHADKPSNFPADLQKILYIQWLLNAGQRPGSALKSPGKDDFLRMRDITIKRDMQFIDGQADHRRWAWIVEMKIRNWKGYNDPTVPRDVQTIVCHATQVDQNLQFELATSLVPFMIFRDALSAVNSRGEQIPIRSVAEFLQTDQMLFVGVGDEPLFVTMAQGRGGLLLSPSSGSVPPLTTVSAAVFLGKVYSKAGLAAAGAYAFRYMKGDMIRIVHGRDAQGEALHHHAYGAGADVGYQNYSAGMQNTPVSRTMLEEFDETDRQRLIKAGFFQRRLWGDAMTSTIRALASAQAGPKHGDGPPKVGDEVQRALESDETYKSLGASIEEAIRIRKREQDACDADPDSTDKQLSLNAAIREVADLYRQRTALKTRVSADLTQKAVGRHREGLRKVAGGAYEEMQRAQEYLAGLDHTDQVTAQMLGTSTGLMRTMGASAELIAKIETALQASTDATGFDTDEGLQSKRNEPGPSRRASEGPSRSRSEVDVASLPGDASGSVDPTETAEPGAIDAEEELANGQSDLDEVQARRASIMLFYEGRLLAESRLTHVEDRWFDNGYCPFCPLEVAGLRESGKGSVLPVGGPFMKRKGDTWVRAPRSKETRKQVRRHLREAHGLIWAAIVAGGELPPFNTDVTSDDRWPTPEPEELAEIHALLDAPLHYTEEEIDEISAAFDWPLTCTDQEFAAAEEMLGGPVRRPTSPFDARVRVQHWTPYAP
ncbi:hypothetical protein PANT_9d00010 [Moesziomyces antarcticus T-34]|uniref:Uncharacterized protein n=1 Tax=Pseudozyma antarctica (strain T-34) TaxID=1151754 RepID=M9LNA8_PSEA3|nr:hypothetical protein PANT_9d00010 [Moesziomyces antarcticus T-34]